MKLFNKNKIEKAFWKGETTISEEELLKKHPNLPKAENAYFRYIETEQVVPSRLQNMVWHEIKKKHQNRYWIYSGWAAAATVTLIIGTIFFTYQMRKQTRLEEQFAVLEYTLNHVSKEITTTSTDDVVYEDDYIIIVATN